MFTVPCRIIVALAFLLAAAPALAQASPAGLEGFGIVLVLGDMQERGTGDNIPATARAALYDLKDFLPYRSYRVLDTAWVLASSATRQAVSTRLQGPDENDYEVTLDRMPLGAPSMQVHFTMREPDGNAERRADAAHRDAQLKNEMLKLSASHAALENQLKKTSDTGEQNALRQRLAEIEIAIETRQREARYAPSGATLIDTSFTMSLSETVVVGTSRMRGGNKALIVLLTAATKGSKLRE